MNISINVKAAKDLLDKAHRDACKVCNNGDESEAGTRDARRAMRRVRQNIGVALDALQWVESSISIAEYGGAIFENCDAS